MQQADRWWVGDSLPPPLVGSEWPWMARWANKMQGTRDRHDAFVVATSWANFEHVKSITAAYRKEKKIHVFSESQLLTKP
jgi:hypothetical protein